MEAERRYTVYGIGNGIVDKQVKVTESELEDLRLRKGYMELADQAEQERILAYLGHRESELHAGGSAANTVVGLAQMGGTVAYTCSLAADELGQHYAADFARLGYSLDQCPQTGTAYWGVFDPGDAGRRAHHENVSRRLGTAHPCGH